MSLAKIRFRSLAPKALAERAAQRSERASSGVIVAMADFDHDEIKDRIRRYRRQLPRYRNDAMARRVIERTIEQLEAELDKHKPKRARPAKR